jgi:hypothetical protein
MLKMSIKKRNYSEKKIIKGGNIYKEVGKIKRHSGIDYFF